VARYYFDIHDGAEFVRDEEGFEFDNLEAAVQAATHSAAEIGQDRLVKGDFSDVVIEVRDEHYQKVLTVTASMRINRHHPLPEPSHPESA